MFRECWSAHFTHCSVSTIINELNTNLDNCETELKKRGTNFFGGSKPGFVDYMIWPWFERTDAFPFILGDKYKELDKIRYCKLLEWKDLMKQDQAVKATILSGDDHYKFFQAYFETHRTNFEKALLAKI